MQFVKQLSRELLRNADTSSNNTPTKYITKVIMKRNDIT